MDSGDARRELDRTLAALRRIDGPRVVAAVARIVGDVGVAEDLAQDALLAALATWPRDGMPEEPGAWFLAAARRRAIDHLRRNRVAVRVHEELLREQAAREAAGSADPAAALDDDVGDDLLRLLFATCHPHLPPESRTALTLRLLGGLTTAEIARAFLAQESTVAQRIVRAKRTLAERKVELELPHGPARAERLGSVLEVIYLIYNEGYTATAGEQWTRPLLCEEALRLGRILAGIAADEPEVHALVALMELHASRLAARTGPGGEPVLLLDQDRSRWDWMLVARGLAALARAQAARAPRGAPAGPYELQAAIAACHGRAREAARTDWERIAALYDELALATGSPVVELNRAVAHGMARGPAAGLALADALLTEPRLSGYHLLPSVRGDLLAKLARREEARSEFLRAASLARNRRERELLERRAAECEPGRDA